MPLRGMPAKGVVGSDIGGVSIAWIGLSDGMFSEGLRMYLYMAGEMKGIHLVVCLGVCCAALNGVPYPPYARKTGRE